jgi:hypothetical protein
MSIFNRGAPDDPEISALNDAYDDFVSGVLAPRDEIDPDIAAAMRQLRQLETGTAEPPGLRAQIWEDLMSTVPSVTAGSLAAPLPQRPRKLDEHTSSGGGRLLPHTSRASTITRWLFAALIVLSVAGGTWWSQRGGGGDPTPTTAALAPRPDGSTPTALEQRPCLALPNPYFDCPNAMRNVGFTGSWTGDALDGGEYQVQLQGWAIATGSSVAGGQSTDSEGWVTDFVINGAYTATFSEQAIVNPGGWTNDAIQYIDAGQPVELVRGDNVSYRLGSLVEIKNPLAEQRLEFKRAVIYRGDITSLSMTADGVTTRAEGDTTLPAKVGVEHRSSLALSLVTLDILPGVPFPPASLHVNAYIGPVDPQTGPADLQGFVLFLYDMQG